MLLNRGIVLTEKYIKKLYQLSIPALYIDDGFLPDVDIEDVISEATRLETIKHVKNIIQNQNKTQTMCGASVLSGQETVNYVYEIIDQLLTNDSLMVNLFDIRTLDDYTYAHSVNVCVLAVMTGINMGLNRAQLFHLAIGALFHDIGKMFIPLHILNKPGSLTDEEFEEIKKHPVYGFKVMRNDSNLSWYSALTAYQHHERYNGEGYPNGLQQDQIHLFSRIVGMVDMYDALTTDRVYRKAHPPNEAYEIIAGSGDYLFDHKVIKYFLHNVAAYPIGTVVQLSSGEITVVVETLPGYSLYPKVRILFTADMRPVTDIVEISLVEHHNITIARVLNENDLSHPYIQKKTTEKTLP